jgi:hypothetical protein
MKFSSFEFLGEVASVMPALGLGGVEICDCEIE